MCPSSVEQAFVGTWRLVRYEYRRADGQLVLPFGDDPVGMLIYDAVGHMSGQLMRRSRAAFRSNSIDGGSPEEVREAFEGYIAYCGTYRVDEQAGTVTHTVVASWYPNFVGSEQVRHYEFQGDRLLLRTPPRRSGIEKRTGLLVWQKAATSLASER